MTLDIKKLKTELTRRGVSPDNMPERVKKFVDLNRALTKGYEVWAQLEETVGRTDWYQIYYLALDKGKPVRRLFWVIEIMDENKKLNIRKYGFSSSAVGMSRVLSATDIVFKILHKCGGVYKQL